MKPVQNINPFSVKTTILPLRYEYKRACDRDILFKCGGNENSNTTYLKQLSKTNAAFVGNFAKGKPHLNVAPDKEKLFFIGPLGNCILNVHVMRQATAALSRIHISRALLFKRSKSKFVLNLFIKQQYYHYVISSIKWQSYRLLFLMQYDVK